MAKFHVNPATGRASQCAATFKCPFGDLENDHYATAAQARKSFEKKMELEAKAEQELKEAKAAKRLGAPIILPTLRHQGYSLDISEALDYDYDSEGGEIDGDGYNRNSSIVNVKIIGWANSGEYLAAYVKRQVGLKNSEPLPESLRAKLQPFVDNFDSDDFEPDIVGGYYGEELQGITPPESLTKVINDYYYSQPDAAGPENILAYLRGKGYDTTGEYPLEAIKGSLQAENKGRISAAVAKAKKWRTASISLKNVKTPSEAQTKIGENDPRPLESPYGKKSPTGAIAGVVLQRSDGTYQLIDGYHRLGELKAKKRQKSTYIILSHEEFRAQDDPNYYYYRMPRISWYKD